MSLTTKVLIAYHCVDSILYDMKITKSEFRGPQVNYKNHEESKATYGVHLVGWLVPPIRNPGNITSVEDLRLLASALMDGTCNWEKISAEELIDRNRVLADKLHSREIKKWKQRSDFGLTRPTKKVGKQGAESSSMGARKRARLSKDYISLSSSSSSSDSNLDSDN